MSKYKVPRRSHDCGLLKLNVILESRDGATWRMLVPIGEEVQAIIPGIHWCPFCGKILKRRF